MKRALALCGGFLLTSVAALAQPQITFAGATITASGITPGGYATWFGITKTQPNWRVQIDRIDARVLDDDGDGVVELTLAAAVPMTSLWAVVDEATSAVTLQRPPGVNLRPLRLTTGALTAIEGGTTTNLTFDCEVLAVLVVRRGEGSWAQTVFDGGTGDSDAVAQHLIALDLSFLQPVDDGPPLKGAPLAAGDVLVIANPDQMGVTAVTVGGFSE